MSDLTPHEFPDSRPQSGNDIILFHIRTTTARIDNIESKFSDSIRKLDQKLEQFVEIGRDISLMQQQMVSYNTNIQQLRDNFRENANTFNRAIERVHERMDSSVREFREYVSETRNDFGSDVSSVQVAHNELSQTVKSWQDRFTGGFAVISVLGFVVAGCGAYFLNLFDERRDQDIQKVATMERRLIEVEEFKKRYEILNSQQPPK